jgi:hypothetical protein
MLSRFQKPVSLTTASQRLDVRRRLAAQTPSGYFVVDDDMEFAIDVAIGRGDDWALGWLAIKYQATATTRAVSRPAPSAGLFPR